MSYITRGLRQKATYWALSAPDGFGGYTFADPVEIKCRWENRTQQLMGPDGNQIVSRARVYVDRDVAIGGWLYLGASTASSPTSLEGAEVIRDFRRTPNLQGTEFERTAFL